MSEKKWHGVFNKRDSDDRIGIYLKYIIIIWLIDGADAPEYRKVYIIKLWIYQRGVIDCIFNCLLCVIKVNHTKLKYLRLFRNLMVVQVQATLKNVWLHSDLQNYAECDFLMSCYYLL
jgi:hypothetical protein